MEALAVALVAFLVLLYYRPSFAIGLLLLGILLALLALLVLPALALLVLLFI